MTSETITVKAEGLTLDQLVWRKYRKPIPRLVEDILALNPGLAQLGPFLPIGTTVVLPILEQPAETQAREIVQLWD